MDVLRALGGEDEGLEIVRDTGWRGDKLLFVRGICWTIRGYKNYWFT